MVSSSVFFAGAGAARLEARGRDDALQVVRGEPAPGEGHAVHLDRGAVELDRLLDRLQRQRDRAALEGEAEHEGVGGDAVAHQRRGKPGRVEDVEMIGA